MEAIQVIISELVPKSFQPDTEPVAVPGSPGGDPATAVPDDILPAEKSVPTPWRTVMIAPNL